MVTNYVSALTARTHRRAPALAFFFLILLLSAHRGLAAGPLNPSFESGTSAYWQAPWGVEIVYDEFPQIYMHNPYLPVHGQFFAIVTNGEEDIYNRLVSDGFSAVAGQTISGYAFFQTYDNLPYNDEGQVAIRSGGSDVQVVFSKSVADVGDFGQTGWTRWQYTVPVTGTYQVEARVVNRGDNNWYSLVGLDAISLTDAGAPLPAYHPRPMGGSQHGKGDPSFTRWLPLSFSPQVSSQPFRTRLGPLPPPWGNLHCTYSIALREDLNLDLNGRSLESPGGITPRYSLTDADGSRLVFDSGLVPHTDVRSRLVRLADGRYQLRQAGPPGQMGQRGRYTYTFEALAGTPGVGRLLSIEDDLGNRHTCVWTSSGAYFLSVTDSSSGRQLLFKAGPSSYLDQVDATANEGSAPAVRTSVSFDTGGHLTQVQVYGGGTSTPTHTATFGYGGPNGDSVVSDAQGVSVTRQSYISSPAKDPLGLPIPRLSQSTEGDAADTTSSEDGGSVAGTVRYTYGPEQTNGGSGQAARTNTVTDARGNTTSLLYSFAADPFDDINQGVIRSTLAAGPTFAGASGPNQWMTVFTPDITNPTQVSLTDPLGRTWQSFLDGMGNVTSTRNPQGETWQFGYSQDGEDLTSATDPTGLRTAFVFGEGAPLSRLTSVADPAGQTQARLTYNSFGQISSVTAPGAVAASGGDETTTFAYDPVTGDLTRITGPLGDSVTFDEYDALGDPLSFSVFPDTGNLVTSQTPLTTHVTWSAAQEVTQVQLPNGVQTLNTWNNGVATGVQARAPGGSVLSQMGFSYDSRGRLYRATDLVGVAAEYRYDKNSNLTRVLDGRGNATRLGYGANNEPTDVTWPGGQSASIRYDTAGRVRSTTDERGIVKNYGYDGADRLTSIEFPAYPGQNLSLSCDAAGRPLTLSDASSSVSIGYSHPNRWPTGVTSTFGGRTYAVSYTYYPDGKRQSMTSPAGTTTYRYDAVGRLSQLTSPFGQTTTWSYDHAGRIAGETTTTATGVPIRTDYQWGVSGLATDLSTAPVYLRGIQQKVNGQPFWTYTLTHSYLGQIVGRDGQGRLGEQEHAVFGYDARGRLASDSSQYQVPMQIIAGGGGGGTPVTQIYTYTGGGNYSYDLSNNLRGGAGGWSYNAANQLTNAPWTAALAGATGLSYDAAGNLVSGNGMTLSWDAWGRLQSVSGTPSGTVSFAYDAAGRRVSKTVGGRTTHFIYDGQVLVCEVDAATGQVLRSYTWGATGLLSDRVGAQSRFYLYDSSGNTRALLDANGNLLGRGVYLAWGAPLASLAPPTPLGWNGRAGAYLDSETGLVLMGARYYARNMGRFISRDPIGFAGGINLYAYCGGDPLNYADPSGLDFIVGPSSAPWFQFNGMGSLEALAAGSAGMLEGFTWGGLSTPYGHPYQSIPGYGASVGLGKMASGALAAAAVVAAGRAVLEAGAAMLPAKGSNSPQAAARAVNSATNCLPRVRPGYTRVYRGTSAPDVLQVSRSMRSALERGEAVPSGAEHFMTNTEALDHAFGNLSQDLSHGVSATTNAATAAGIRSHTIVYDVPNSIFERLPQVNPLQAEVVFKYSIPNAFRVGVTKP